MLILNPQLFSQKLRFQYLFRFTLRAPLQGIITISKLKMQTSTSKLIMYIISIEIDLRVKVCTHFEVMEVFLTQIILSTDPFKRIWNRSCKLAAMFVHRQAQFRKCCLQNRHIQKAINLKYEQNEVLISRTHSQGHLKS